MILFGYIDPGAGSLVAQVVAAGAAGVAVAVKLGWRRARSAVRGQQEAREQRDLRDGFDRQK